MWPFSRSPKMIGVDSSAREIRRAVRSDAWMNIFTKLGRKGRDKRTGGRFVIEPVTTEEVYELWMGDSLMATVIEALPRDSMSKGLVVKATDKAESERIHAVLEELNFGREFVRAKMFERAYGGAALFPYINDGGDLSEQLNEASLTLPEHLTLFEPRELYPMEWYTDATDKKYGKVKLWRVVPISSHGVATAQQLIHESRLIIFPGIRVSRAHTPGIEHLGWGGNVPTRLNEKLRDLNLSWAAAAALIQDFSQAVIKLQGLAKLIENEEDDEIMNRLLQLEMSRSVLRALVLDKDDEFKREQTPMGGLREILVEFMTWFATAAEMPVTKLFQVAPAGLNATGEGDQTNWDDRCVASQDEHMPQLEQGLRMIMLAQNGPTKGKEPKEWSVEFNPLRKPTPLEDAQIRKIVAETDAILIDALEISPEEAASSHYGGDTYSPHITIDWEKRAKQEQAVDPVVEPEQELPQLIDPEGDPLPQKRQPGGLVPLPPGSPAEKAAAARAAAQKAAPNGAPRAPAR